MILKATDNKDENFGINVYKISLSDFGNKEYHPFIAAQDWDWVEIDLCEDTPKGFLRQIIKNVKVIPKFDKENVSVKVMQLLCELLPDYSAKLRSAFLKDRERFDGLIAELSIQYGW